MRYVHLLSCGCRSEAGLCPCLITFQHLHGLGTGQRCVPESLRCSNPCRDAGSSGNGS